MSARPWFQINGAYFFKDPSVLGKTIPVDGSFGLGFKPRTRFLCSYACEIAMSLHFSSTTVMLIDCKYIDRLLKATSISNIPQF